MKRRGFFGALLGAMAVPTVAQAANAAESCAAAHAGADGKALAGTVGPEVPAMPTRYWLPLWPDGRGGAWVEIGDDIPLDDARAVLARVMARR
jgi:hypothetical protein